MAVAEREERTTLQFRASPSLRQRVQELARVRGTTEGTTTRWLVERGLDWYEGLSREQKASA